MLRRQLITALLATLLLVALGVGIVRLFSLRLQQGDVYPAYSTLRADPLGAKAYLEALDALPGTEVRRNFRPLPRLKPAESVTLIYAGAPRVAQWGQDELHVFETLVASGSRAVFAFQPVPPEKLPKKSDDAEAKEGEEKKDGADAKEQASGKDTSGEKDVTGEKDTTDEKKDAKKNGGKADREEKERAPTIAFAEVAKKWGFEFSVVVLKPGEKPPATTAQLADTSADLEAELPWHSALFFDKLQPAWRTLYTCSGRAVVIERRWGDGSLVLVSDAFLLSNEALGGTARRPRLLAALAGPHRTIVFDEEHHGVSEQQGIVDLGKKYRLHGLAAGLLLVAALFIWKNSVRFLPAYEAEDSSDAPVAGRESAAGFTSLLRRSIPRGRILEMCVAEWRKSFAHQDRELGRVEAAFASHHALPARQRDPVAGYRHIVRTLAGNHSRPPDPAARRIPSPAEPPAP